MSVLFLIVVTKLEKIRFFKTFSSKHLEVTRKVYTFAFAFEKQADCLTR